MRTQEGGGDAANETQRVWGARGAGAGRGGVRVWTEQGSGQVTVGRERTGCGLRGMGTGPGMEMEGGRRGKGGVANRVSVTPLCPRPLSAMPALTHLRGLGPRPWAQSVPPRPLQRLSPPAAALGQRPARARPRRRRAPGALRARPRAPPSARRAGPGHRRRRGRRCPTRPRPVRGEGARTLHREGPSLPSGLSAWTRADQEPGGAGAAPQACPAQGGSADAPAHHHHVLALDLRLHRQTVTSWGQRCVFPGRPGDGGLSRNVCGSSSPRIPNGGCEKGGAPAGGGVFKKWEVSSALRGLRFCPTLELVAGRVTHL